MEDNCGGDQGLNWTVEPRKEREREREREKISYHKYEYFPFQNGTVMY
jgi:hypothetical protein